jgi:2-C-methyl-D-erythritol 4-phosphate cytidylyltransferase
MNKYAIIVAGGSGTRMGTDLPKQFLVLGKQPVLWHTITAFLEAFENIQIILVLPEEHMERGNDIIQSVSSPDRIIMVKGGGSRFHSVQSGLEQVPAGCLVAVHDGVRCLVTVSLIQKCYEEANIHGNAIPATTAVDTIRIATGENNEMIERSKVRIIQTPQVFKSSLLKEAYRKDFSHHFTDDASVVESIGEKIHLVEGDPSNIKITRKIDLLIATQILSERHSC